MRGADEIIFGQIPGRGPLQKDTCYSVLYKGGRYWSLDPEMISLTMGPEVDEKGPEDRQLLCVSENLSLLVAAQGVYAFESDPFLRKIEKDVYLGASRYWMPHVMRSKWERRLGEMVDSYRTFLLAEDLALERFSYPAIMLATADRETHLLAWTFLPEKI